MGWNFIVVVTTFNSMSYHLAGGSSEPYSAKNDFQEIKLVCWLFLYEDPKSDREKILDLFVWLDNRPFFELILGVELNLS